MSELYNLLKTLIGKVNDTASVNEIIKEGAGIHITTNNPSITLSIKGNGTIKLMTDYDYHVLELSTENCSTVTIDTTRGYLCISDVHYITELDIHGQGVTNFIVTAESPLNKLIIYDNQLQELDLSNCKYLQFLHMHNNPMCDSDRYRENLLACMNSLPNRRLSATGSIILYPWYGLEVLICKDSEGNYIKYPVGWSQLSLEDGRLYGVVENGTITYHIYKNNQLTPYEVMNRHHSLRKELEDVVCLNKNWIFGSAIMYSDDWQYCTWDFRYNNIADMWETAEKGFGLTFGCSDSFTNTLPGFENLNIKDMRIFGAWDTAVEDLPKALDYTSENDWKKYSSNPNNPYKKYLRGERLHGDAILSIVFGTQWSENPKDRRFGYIPNSMAALNDSMTVTGYDSTQLDAFDITMKYLTSNSDGLSFSFGLRGKDEGVNRARTVLGKFGENNILLVSAGNHGDGLPYTSEPNPSTKYHGSYANYAGDYSDVDGDGNTITKPTSTMYVGSCGPMLDVSPFSSSSTDVDLQYSNRATYLTTFGDQIFVWNNYLKTLKCGAGTSYSSPMCCSILLLFRNIYSKMFKDETCFGKVSNFMNHVRNRWCIHIDSNMDFAEGYGIPHPLASPYAPKLIENNTNGWEPGVTYRKEVPVGSSIGLNYKTKDTRTKSTCTVEPKLSYVAIDSCNDIHPLKPMKDTTLRLFSNSSLVSTIDDRENYHTCEIQVTATENNVVPIDGALELCEDVLMTEYCNEGVVKVCADNLDCDEFTIQFALDFTDKLFPQDVGQYTTTRDLFYFTNGDELGRFYINNISYTTNSKYIELTNDTKLHHRYFSDVTSRDRNLIETQSVGFGIQNMLDFEVSPYAIISVTFSKKYITYYLNGTYIGRILKLPQDNIKLSNVYINKQSLCHDDINCVRVYNRVLSEKEIIQNTIAMLNNHFDEEIK